MRLPHKFEAGTPAIAVAIGLGAAIDYLTALVVERVVRYEHELLTMRRKIVRYRGVRIIGTAREKASVCRSTSTACIRTTSERFWIEEGIAVRAGHHCAQPVMQRFDVPATARASFAFYNTFEEVDQLVTGIVRSDVQKRPCLREMDAKPALPGLDTRPQPEAAELRQAGRRDPRSEGLNPLCGDHIWVTLHLTDDTSQASPSKGSLRDLQRPPRR